jgi:hypothetical protein
MVSEEMFAAAGIILATGGTFEGKYCPASYCRRFDQVRAA